MIYGNWKPKKTTKTKRLRLKQDRFDYVKAADDVFSLYLRELHDWKCTKCGRQHERNSPSLTNSHYVSRTDRRFRWFLKNCDPFCWVPCHSLLESKKNTEYRYFMIKKLGEKYYYQMELVSNIVYITAIQDEAIKELHPELLQKLLSSKSDPQMEYMYWKQEYDRLCAEKHVTNIWEERLNAEKQRVENYGKRLRRNSVHRR